MGLCTSIGSKNEDDRLFFRSTDLYLGIYVQTQHRRPTDHGTGIGRQRLPTARCTPPTHQIDPQMGWAAGLGVIAESGSLWQMPHHIQHNTMGRIAMLLAVGWISCATGIPARSRDNGICCRWVLRRVWLWGGARCWPIENVRGYAATGVPRYIYAPVNFCVVELVVKK